MLRLERVDARHRDAFREMALEFRAEGDERFADVLDGWEEYLAHVERFRQARDLPADRVQQTSFLAFDGEELVGGARLRHRRVEVLERDGGNIGYEVRPSVRRRGYGHRILALVLEEARGIGVRRLLLTAETGNIASIRAIERAGGKRTGMAVSHHSFRTMARYHIDLAPHATYRPASARRRTERNRGMPEDGGWQRLASRTLFESPWFHLRQDQVRLPAGDEITYTFVEHGGYAMVVPLLDDGQVMLERVYRYTVQRTLLECPSGGLDDELPEVAARRELREETGWVANTMEPLGSFFGSNGISDERFHLFLARGLEREGEPMLEATEQIELEFMPFEEALRRALAGQIEDAPTSLALILAGQAIPG